MAGMSVLTNGLHLDATHIDLCKRSVEWAG